MAIVENIEGSDIWDDVYFPRWVFQDTKFVVEGSENVDIYNIGSTSIIPRIIVDSDFTIKSPTNTISLTKGTYTDTQLVFERGENKLTLTGTGTIEFQFYREEMI